MSNTDLHASEFQLARFSLLCSNLVWIIPGSAASAFALSVAAADQLSPTFRYSWLGVVALTLVVRTIYLRQWLKEPTTPETVDYRIRVATVFTTLTACCFGVFGYLAVSLESPIVSLLVIMVLTGMVATATAAVSYMLPMYWLFIFPLMLPVGIRMFSFAEPSTVWIGGLILLYLGVSVGSSRSIRASIFRSIELRFENVELLDDLKNQHKVAEIALAREEKANLAKSRFLAAASHDLRQPLHSLRLFTATLEMQTRNSQHKTLVSKIDSSVKSLEELFNALLDISKLDAGTISVEQQHVSIRAVLSQIEHEFRPLAMEKGLDFHVHHESEIVHTDAILLDRLMRNLVANAIRYTDSGRVEVSTRVDENRLWLTVADTGVGIPLADQSRIFEEFVQLGNAERDRNQGIGLGLSIVKRLADLLDVHVRVSSTVQQGSTFTVGVPIGDATLSRLSDKPEIHDSDHVDALFILVIDDEEEVCQAVEGLLETWGCIVMCATSGDAAIKQLEEIGEVPDLVISDYRLREGETGGDVIVRIREKLNAEIPAIILTGDIAPDRLLDIKSLGFPLLHKPCEPDALRQLIARETHPVHTVAREVG